MGPIRRDRTGEGMTPQMGRQLGKTAEGPLAQMMFDAFDVGEMIAVVEPHQLKEIGQHGVTLAYFFRDPAAFGSEGKSTIGFIA